MNVIKNGLKKGYNDIIITHGDADAMGAAAFAEMDSINAGRGVIVIGDMNPVTTRTDEMLELALSKFNEDNILHIVFITDRAMCSKEMIAKLNSMDVCVIVYLDHHVTNKKFAEELEVEYNSTVFTNINTSYSATWIAYNTLIWKTDLDSVEAKIQAILIDAWDTFKWSRCITEDDKDGSDFLLSEYGLDIKTLSVKQKESILPLDKKAVDFNYIAKFEDIEFMYSAILNSIRNGEQLTGYEVVGAKYARLQEKLLVDLKAEWEMNLDFEDKPCSNYYTLRLPNRDNLVSVFVADTILPFTVNGIVAHYFLKENPITILITKSSDTSNKFNVRSLGDVDATHVAKLFRGGGHPNACGFTIESDEGDMTKEEIRSHIDKILKTVY